MKRFSTAQLCLAMLVTFVAGGAVALRLAPSEPAAPPRAALAGTCKERDDVWLARALQQAAQRVDDAEPVDQLQQQPEATGDAVEQALAQREEGDHERSAFSDAVDLLTNDGEARAALLARYRDETDPQQRRRMRALLGFVTTPDVARYAGELTRAADAQLRREGFQLLQQHDSSEARATVAHALEHEQEPGVLRAAIHATQGREQRSPTEVQSMVGRLQPLSAHREPGVRAESVLALARWDRSPAVETTLTRGLADASADVREASVMAVVESGLRTDPIKAQLLHMLDDTGSDPELRARARDALQGFALDEREFAALGSAGEETEQ